MKIKVTAECEIDKNDYNTDDEDEILIAIEKQLLESSFFNSDDTIKVEKIVS